MLRNALLVQSPLTLKPTRPRIIVTSFLYNLKSMIKAVLNKNSFFYDHKNLKGPKYKFLKISTKLDF